VAHHGARRIELRQSSYGWVVVLCAFTLMFVGFGAAYSFAAFFRAFETEFGASRAHVSLVFSLCAFLYFLLGAPGGMLADRYGTRNVALAGVAFLAAGLAAASYATSVAILYATYSIGLGIGIGLTYVPSVGAVQPWFEKRRVLASGIAVSGIGAGNLLVPPLAAWWIESFGWRGAYLALAAWHRGAGRRGRRGDPQPAGGAGSRHRGHDAARGAAHAQFLGALREPRADGLRRLRASGAHRPYAMDAGHPESFAVLLVSLIGLGSLLGRFGVGSLAERFGRMRSLALMYLGMALMLLLWWASTGALALSVMAVGFGISYGGFVATFPTVVMDLFGARSVAGIIGCIYTAAGIGTLFGPPAAGAAFDASGSYGAIIACAALLNLVAAAASAALLRAQR
jgi:MFS family permease